MWRHSCWSPSHSSKFDWLFADCVQILREAGATEEAERGEGAAAAEVPSLSQSLLLPVWVMWLAVRPQTQVWCWRIVPVVSSESSRRWAGSFRLTRWWVHNDGWVSPTFSFWGHKHTVWTNGSRESQPLVSHGSDLWFYSKLTHFKIKSNLQMISLQFLSIVMIIDCVAW